MLLTSPWKRAQRYYRRKAASYCYRRPLAIEAKRPVISFTFDDFPKSALTAGGSILKQFGLVGTYYVALGLLGGDSPSGPIVDASELPGLLEDGHELGCHTFAHCDSWETDARSFERSIVENRDALKGVLPGVEFQTFSYPISLPRPATKARVARYFACSRAGGQTFNTGTADLNQLSAFFLEKSRGDRQAVKDLIDRNRGARGWLIFATHDISENPSPFGCTPEFFEDIVQYTAASGSQVLPITKALAVYR
jgi:peptidoglycan/xylan/chitin deacetylase (PgdA/CDA1 family)